MLLPALSMTEYNNDKELLDCSVLSKDERKTYINNFGDKYKPYFKRIKSNTKIFEVDKTQIRRMITIIITIIIIIIIII